MLLTDVDTVVAGWATAQGRPVWVAKAAPPRSLDLAERAMRTKVEAAAGSPIRPGIPAYTRALAHSSVILGGQAGTFLSSSVKGLG